MDVTQRLGLRLLASGQAAKEATVNESLQALDTAVAASIEEDARNDPPASPATGACYLVGTNPTGDWAGKAGHLACHSPNGWRFIAPVDGLSATIRTSGLTVAFLNGSWTTGIVRASAVHVGGQAVVGARAGAIANPAGGSVIDAEARTAIASILAALRGHGLIAP